MKRHHDTVVSKDIDAVISRTFTITRNRLKAAREGKKAVIKVAAKESDVDEDGDGDGEGDGYGSKGGDEYDNAQIY